MSSYSQFLEKKTDLAQNIIQRQHVCSSVFIRYYIMGRKQKVRQDRRATKIKEQLESEYQSSLEMESWKNTGGFLFPFLFSLFVFGFSLSLHFLFYPGNTAKAIYASVMIALIAFVEGKKPLQNKMSIANNRTGPDLQDFPTSDSLLQGFKLFKDGNRNQAIDRYMDGATEYGCVHSMYMLGLHRDGGVILKGKFIHLAQPWFIEGAIRGSASVTAELVEVYLVYQFRKTKALTTYWIEIKCQYLEWSGGSKIVRKSEMKTIKGKITRSCAVCSKTDTKTLTLQQCMGCSMYCYCGEGCQRTHTIEPNASN